MNRDVFISYSSQDKTIADAVCARLEQDGIRCWIAPRDILPGAEYGAAIIEAIATCKIMLLVFSATANASPQVRKEAERALGRGLIIIPFRIENVLPTAAMEFILYNVHWLDAMTPPLATHIAKLADAIHQFLGDERNVVHPGPNAVRGAAAGPAKRAWGKAAMIATALVAVALAGVAFVMFGGRRDPQRSAGASSNAAVSTVVIGTQTWTAQNLDVAVFNNGEPIPQAKSNEDWKRAAEAKTPAWCFYGNDPAMAPKHGRLYNWYAVTDPRGIAPAGFHVPTKGELEALLTQLGPGAVSYVALKPGGSAKFNALAGGARMDGGEFLLRSAVAYWSCSEGYRGSGHAFHLVLDEKKRNADIMYYKNGMGFSVRCVQGPAPEEDNPVDEYRRLTGKDPAAEQPQNAARTKGDSL